MEKYLGNKRGLLDAIYAFVSARCGTATSLCDVFAGTTNVGRYFRRRGYDIVSNDINRFSYVLGGAYLATQRYPTFEGITVAGSSRIEALHDAFRTAARRDADQLFPQHRTEAALDASRRTAEVLSALNDATGTSRQRLLHHYTVYGDSSTYRSTRGGEGRRNYFSKDNATRLDAALDQIRTWWRQDRLSQQEVHVLLSSVLEEVCIVANVNGIFHDFNRHKLWPNALQSLLLRVPLIAAQGNGATIYADDALRIAPYLPACDILYLDPPYNFRQYTAYYHLLNFIAAYPFLDDPDAYLAELQFVRGQNMTDDFQSTFSMRDKFLASLRSLIEHVPARYVVLSYYGGRNHWNHWAKTEEPTDSGLQHLVELFADTALFESYEAVPVLQLRQNYQSRGGARKTMVNEHLLFGTRRTVAEPVRTEAPRLAETNRQLGLDHFVPYYASRSLTTPCHYDAATKVTSLWDLD